MKIPIIFEDNHLLVVEKPVNIPVQEDRSGDKDLLTMLKADLKIRYKKPGNVFLGLVHRLDRPVGGVIVFAKTSKAASRLSDAIRRQAMERKYLAIVHGVLEKKEAVLEHYLVKDHLKNIVEAVSQKHKNAKRASLEYEVIGSQNGLSLLSVQLHTGRPHQIRVQLSAIGHPIVGDQKYGENMNKPGQQIALWAFSLALPHPITKEILPYTSKPPTDYPWNLFMDHLAHSF